jgi:hypothetical protein
MFTTNLLIQEFLIPLVISAIFMFFWKPLKKESLPILNGFWTFPLAFSIAFIVSNILILGFPQLPPSEASQWLVFVALTVLLVGLIDAFEKTPKVVNHFFKLAGIFFSIVVTLLSYIKSTWTSQQSYLHIFGIGIVSFIYLKLFEKILSKEGDLQRVVAPITIGLMSAGTAGLALTSKTLSVAQLAGLIGVTIIPIFVTSIVKPSFSMKKSASSVFLLFLAMWLNIWFYAQPYSTGGFGLTITSPLFSFIAELKVFSKLKDWQKVLLKVILMIIPMVAGLLLSYNFNETDGY